jgi:hypothetical protein
MHLSTTKGTRACDKSNSKRLSISFIIPRNKDFGEKKFPPSDLIGYPNITIIYSDFSLVKDGELKLESGKI